MARAMAPRGTNTVFKAAIEALDAIPEVSRKDVAKAFAAKLREHIRTLKVVKPAKTKAGGRPVGRPAGKKAATRKGASARSTRAVNGTGSRRRVTRSVSQTHDVDTASSAALSE